MTNTYKVIIIDPSEYTLEEGDNQYDLYALWEKGELPHGVWYEEWTVPDGQEWDSHPSLATHHLCKHNCYLVDWEELQEPWNVKPKKWWTAKRDLLHAIKVAQSKLDNLATIHMNEVVEVLGLEHENFDEYVQGHTGRIADCMVTGFILSKVNTVISDIQGDEITVDE